SVWLSCDVEGAVPSVAGLQRGAVDQCRPKLCRAQSFGADDCTDRPNAQWLCGNRTSATRGGDRRTGDEMHHDVRSLPRADVAARTSPATRFGAQPGTDPKPRALGIPVPVFP